MTPDRMHCIRAAVALLLLSFPIHFSPAQDLHAPARIAGAAYSNTANATGVDALGINPALIVLPKGSTVSIAVLPLAFSAGTDFTSYEIYQQYFVGAPYMGTRRPVRLTDADKTIILGAFPGSEGTLHTTTSATLLAATLTTPAGSFGVNIRDRIASSAVVPKAMFEFLLNGNTPGASFDFSKTRLYSSWTREYAATYAHRFVFNKRQNAPAVAFGASFKVVHGYGYFGLDNFNTHFTTDPDSFVVDGHAGMHARYAGTEWLQQGDVFKFQLFPSPVGSGFGLDLGFMTDLNNSIRLAVGVTDLGGIVWNRNAREASTNEDFHINDLSSDEQFDAIRTRMNGTERDIQSFTTPLPTAITIGAAFTMHRFLGTSRPLVMTMAVREGLNTVPGNSTIPHVAIGAEMEVLDQLPMRAGLAVGGDLPAMLAVGIGLRMESFTLDIGTNSLNSLLAAPRTSASMAVTGRIEF